MENEDNSDKLTEARSSQQKQSSSILKRVYMKMCACMPCLNGSFALKNIDKKSSYHKQHFDGASELRESKQSKSVMSDPSSVTPIDSWGQRKEYLFKSVYEHANRLLQEYDESLDKSTIKKWHSYSIYEYRENQLLALGTAKGRVLCKINCTRVEPSMIAKKKTNQSRSYELSSQKYSCSNFDKYWNRRYLLFERFDEGISLDDESWYSTTPQAVAEHIAGKIRCDTVLDGFCGAGGDSIKLSNTCSRVICNDICQVKLKCLQTNAKVYNVQNIEMINENFLDLDGIEPDIVYLAPPFNPEQTKIQNSIDPITQMKPPLNQVFRKAIRMTKNIVMLLPPNINMQKLGQLIAREYIDSGIHSSSCSIKIQKIFFMSQFKYIIVYLGSMIENEVSLNEELLYIYNYLKEGEKKHFTHKKVIRFLREKYGMINMLNYLYELDKVQQSGTLIQKLYQMIRDRHLIDEHKLSKLIHEQNEEVESESYNRKKIPLISSEKEEMQEQKYVNEEKEVTLSYYSSENSANKAVRDSKIEETDQRLSVQSSGKQSESVIVMQEIPRTNTVQFCAFRGSLESDQCKKDMHQFETYH